MDPSPLNHSKDNYLRTSLRRARVSVYLFQFFASGSWAIYNVVYTYLLVRVGKYSYQTAAFWATFEWVGYALCQALSNPMWGALSDRVGRRPLLILAQSVVTSGMLLYSIPIGWLYALTGSIQGLFDCTWALSNAIVVDCVAVGAPPGDASDIWLARFLRYLVERKSFAQPEGIIFTHMGGAAYLTAQEEEEEEEENRQVATKVEMNTKKANVPPPSPMASSSPPSEAEETRHTLSVSFTVTWIIGGFGSLCGYLTGLLFATFLPLTVAMVTSALSMLVPFLYFIVFLPETKPYDKTHRAPFLGGDPSLDHSSKSILYEVRESFAAQASALKLVFHSRRSTLLAFAYFSVYFVLTGIYDLGLFWGELIYNWPVSYSTIFLVTITIAPGIGILLLQLLLIPILDFSMALVSLCLLSALAATILSFSGLLALVPGLLFTIITLACLFMGAYPVLTGLLTADIEHESQGHLQGALFAFTTLGSLLALGTYLIFFQLTIPSSVWIVSAFFVGLASFASYLAGDGDTRKPSNFRISQASPPPVLSPPSEKDGPNDDGGLV